MQRQAEMRGESSMHAPPHAIETRNDDSADTLEQLKALTPKANWSMVGEAGVASGILLLAAKHPDPDLIPKTKIDLAKRIAGFAPARIGQFVLLWLTALKIGPIVNKGIDFTETQASLVKERLEALIKADPSKG